MSTSKVDPALLRATPIFNSLSDSELEKILQAPENSIEEYEPKKLVIRESEIGNCMYIILEGSVDVLISSTSGNRDISITTLRAGDFFGEQSLLPDSTGRRNATIKTMRPTKLFKIDKKYVLMGVKKDDSDNAYSSEDVTQINKQLPPDEVRDTLLKIRLFNSLSREELLSIDEWTEIVSFGPGDFVVKAGQTGEFLFVVLEGSVEIFTLDDDGKIVILATLKHGDYFGEQALMPDSKGKRNAFARTDNKTRLIKISKQFFRLILNRDSELYKELKSIHDKQNQQRGGAA